MNVTHRPNNQTLTLALTLAFTQTLTLTLYPPRKGRPSGVAARGCVLMFENTLGGGLLGQLSPK